MAKPSISIPDELLDDFDQKIKKLRREGKMDIDTHRSEVVQELIRQWVNGDIDLDLEPLQPDD